jgi:hypothetical protein
MNNLPRMISNVLNTPKLILVNILYQGDTKPQVVWVETCIESQQSWFDTRLYP